MRLEIAWCRNLSLPIIRFKSKRQWARWQGESEMQMLLKEAKKPVRYNLSTLQDRQEDCGLWCLYVVCFICESIGCDVVAVSFFIVCVSCWRYRDSCAILLGVLLLRCVLIMHFVMCRDFVMTSQIDSLVAMALEPWNTWDHVCMSQTCVVCDVFFCSCG